MLKALPLEERKKARSERIVLVEDLADLKQARVDLQPAINEAPQNLS